MKYNPIIAVVAFIFGLGGSLVAFSLSEFSADLAVYGSITLIASILGLVGIFLFDKDYKVAIVQYVVCGMSIFVGASLVGILGCLFYMIAAVLAYIEREKSDNFLTDGFNDINYYGNEVQIKQRYRNFPTNINNRFYWIMVIISVILIVSAGVLGFAGYNYVLQQKSEGLLITNISADLKESYGYYSGGVQGTLTSTNDIENVQVKGVWYGKDGTQLAQTYNSNSFDDISADQKYQINIPYFKESQYKPVKVKIQIYENYEDTPLYTQTVNFN